MRTGEFQTQTIYRLQWMQANGRTRSRLFARKASAQRKADKMRAEGRDPLIEVCLLIRPGPDGYPAGDS